MLHEKKDRVERAEEAHGSHSSSHITRRRGYEALSTASPTATSFPHEGSEVPVGDNDEDEDATTGKLQNLYDVTQSWRILGLSFTASGLLTVRVQPVLIMHYPSLYYTFSYRHISSQSFLMFLFSEYTLPENGCGISPPAFRMLAKVCLPYNIIVQITHFS